MKTKNEIETSLEEKDKDIVKEVYKQYLPMVKEVSVASIQSAINILQIGKEIGREQGRQETLKEVIENVQFLKEIEIGCDDTKCFSCQIKKIAFDRILEWIKKQKEVKKDGNKF